MQLRNLLPLVILAASAAGAVALMKTRPEAVPIQREEKAWLVDVVRVERGSHVPTLTLYGRVETPRAARLTAALGADVVSVLVREGERAQAGQVLIMLDDRESQLLLRQREAEVAEIGADIELERQSHANDVEALARESRVLELARRAVERAENLARSNAGSRSQLDSARQEEEQRSMAVDARRTAIDGHASRMRRLEARLARAEALRDRARLDVERARVRAPFSGPVSALDVATGDRVQPGSPLLSMFDDDALELRVQVPTLHLPAIRAALAARHPVLAQAEVGGRGLRAALDRLGAQVERGSGGVDALFDVLEGGSDLPLGLTVELQVALVAEPDTIAVPAQALYGADHVYRVVEGRMRRVAVQRVGETRSGAVTRVLLRSEALRSGDRVVSTQLPNAVDGLRVEVAS